MDVHHQRVRHGNLQRNAQVTLSKFPHTINVKTNIKMFVLGFFKYFPVRTICVTVTQYRQFRCNFFFSIFLH